MENRTGVVLLICFAVLTAVGRMMVPGHDLSPAGTYEAFAHIYVGCLLMGLLVGWRRGLCGWLLVLLSVLETLMFLGR